MAVEVVQKNMFQLFRRISTYLKVFSSLALLILYHIYLGMKSCFCKFYYKSFMFGYASKAFFCIWVSKIIIRVMDMDGTL